MRKQRRRRACAATYLRSAGLRAEEYGEPLAAVTQSGSSSRCFWGDPDAYRARGAADEEGTTSSNKHGIRHAAVQFVRSTREKAFGNKILPPTCINGRRGFFEKIRALFHKSYILLRSPLAPPFPHRLLRPSRAACSTFLLACSAPPAPLFFHEL